MRVFEYFSICVVLTAIMKTSFAKSVSLPNRINENNSIDRNIQLTGLQQLRILRHLIKDCENVRYGYL